DDGRVGEPAVGVVKVAGLALDDRVADLQPAADREAGAELDADTLVLGDRDVAQDDAASGAVRFDRPAGAVEAVVVAQGRVGQPGRLPVDEQTGTTAVAPAAADRAAVEGQRAVRGPDPDAAATFP